MKTGIGRETTDSGDTSAGGKRKPGYKRAPWRRELQSHLEYFFTRIKRNQVRLMHSVNAECPLGEGQGWDPCKTTPKSLGKCFLIHTLFWHPPPPSPQQAAQQRTRWASAGGFLPTSERACTQTQTSRGTEQHSNFLYFFFHKETEKFRSIFHRRIRRKKRTKIYQDKSNQQDQRNPVSSRKRYTNPKAINPQRPRRKFKQETNVWKMVNLRSSWNPHSHPQPLHTWGRGLRGLLGAEAGLGVPTHWLHKWQGAKDHERGQVSRVRDGEQAQEGGGHWAM